MPGVKPRSVCVLLLVAGPLLGLNALAGSSTRQVSLKRAKTMTIRASLSSSGAQGDAYSVEPSISNDGRYVAFLGYASNLVPGDTNEGQDIFRRDRLTRTTELVSVDSNGVQADDSTSNPAVSADGRFVAFEALATNLVPGDTNGDTDIFVRDCMADTTERVSIDSSGIEADSGSARPSISADGRFVAFFGQATNLVPGDTNDAWDTFIHDRLTATTERVSVGSGGAQGDGHSTGNALGISADGRYVAFPSEATDLVPGDTNLRYDVFVRDRLNSTTERVSIDSSGVQGNDSSGVGLSMSADGRYVVFASQATNLVSGDTNGRIDVFVHDRSTGTTERVSVDSTGAQGNGGSATSPSISDDGHFVAFGSTADNLVAGDTNGFLDSFVHDRSTGTTVRVSVSTSGAQADNHVHDVVISGNGSCVAFHSDATNLVPGDTNSAADVFMLVPMFLFMSK